MANLLRGRKASHNSSYEGFDLSHNMYFTSSVGHVLPIHFDFLLPGDKVNIKTHMTSRLMPMNSASPIELREHVDYYFVPLQCLYSLFPSLLSDTNEDASSSIFESTSFTDGIPMCEINDVKNYFLANERTSQDRVYPDVREFDSWNRDANRLIEFFKYGNLIPASDSIPVAKKLNVNLLLLQAYQSVYQYFFRDSDREEFNPSMFNVDRFYSTLNIPTNDAKYLFQLYYRPWKKDPYTIVSPSPLGGASSLNHFADVGSGDNQFISFVNQWLSNAPIVAPASVVDRNGKIQTTVGTYDPTNGTSSLAGSDVSFANGTNAGTAVQSLQQHRIAQAIEKLSAIWSKSGKNYKDMMSNLFGVKVAQDWTKPLYIGSDSNQITINEEVANVTTAGGDNEVLTYAGEITGRGYGKSYGNGVKFTAERHGILLALYSCVPNAVYGSHTLDMFNTYSKRNSFPNPLQDELGEQPLFEFEFRSDDTVNTTQYGWLPRFHELKLKEDRAYGGFLDGLSYWLPFKDSYYGVSLSPNALNNRYIYPHYLDNIMLKKYDGVQEYDASHPFSSDPLMHFFRVEEFKASKMSSFGVPKTYFG